MIRLIVLTALVVGRASAQVEVSPLVEEWTDDEMVGAYTQVTWSTLVRDGDQLVVVDLPPVHEPALEKKLKDGNFEPHFLDS